jgi:hypothetical protein
MVRLECKRIPVSLIDTTNMDNLLESIKEQYAKTEYPIKFVSDFQDVPYESYKKYKDKKQHILFSDDDLTLYIYKDLIIQIKIGVNGIYDVSATMKPHYEEICYNQIDVELEKLEEDFKKSKDELELVGVENKETDDK